MTSRSVRKETNERERPARLIHVAHRADVSRATAARALGGYGLVGDETRERVLAAAREPSYSANVVARVMRAGKTQTIGVVVADISNSFFNHATRAIIDTAAKAGYQSRPHASTANRLRTIAARFPAGRTVSESASVKSRRIRAAMQK